METDERKENRGQEFNYLCTSVVVLDEEDHKITTDSSSLAIYIHKKGDNPLDLNFQFASLKS